LTPDNHQPKPGETIRITIGFGHHYPQGVMDKEGMVDRVYAVTPEGTQIDAETLSPSTYTLTTATEGTYRLYAALNPGFVSNTTEGRTVGNKKTLSNVVSCFAYRIAAMTLVTCGDKPQENFKKGVLDLEVIPRKDTDGHHDPHTTTLQVFFQGKPLAGAQVMAACSGRPSASEHSEPLKTTTDADGMAKIKRTGGGSWLFTARHKLPYPDTDECDEYSYSTSLTLDF